MNAALHAREVVSYMTQVIAIEILAAVMAIRQRLSGLRRSGDYHPVGVDVLGKGSRAVWDALHKASPAIFDIPLTRDAVYYPYLELVVSIVESGRLVEAIRHSGIGFKGVRSQVKLTDD